MPRLIKLICLLLVTFVTSYTFAASAHQYEIQFNEKLTEVNVTINLGHAQSRLKARNSYENLFTQAARDCHTDKIVSYVNQSLFPEPSSDCIRYSMRLDPKQNTLPFNTAHRSLVTRPSEWLFLPKLKNSERVKVKVVTAIDHNLSVPWEKINNTERQYRISASPQSADGLIVVGDFEQQLIKHTNTELRVAYLPGRAIDHDKIARWLRNTIDNVNLAYGSFPHANPQIIISAHGRPWSRHKSPVPYARVVRDFGESVQFYIDQRQSLNQFTQDWTATHEFSHLMLPYISWKNRWLSEGFASYYQNILLARAGVYSEQKAWQKLYDGFMRGKLSAPELSPNTAARENWGGNMKVYWSGAALYFVADQMLRRESNNTKSLDKTLKKLKNCCLPSNRSWNGSQLMRKLDQLSDSRVFTRLYAQHANSQQFVDFESEFEKLGISISNGKVKLSQNPDFVKRRKQVMSAPVHAL